MFVYRNSKQQQHQQSIQNIRSDQSVKLTLKPTANQQRPDVNQQRPDVNQKRPEIIQQRPTVNQQRHDFLSLQRFWSQSCILLH